MDQRGAHKAEEKTNKEASLWAGVPSDEALCEASHGLCEASKPKLFVVAHFFLRSVKALSKRASAFARIDFLFRRASRISLRENSPLGDYRSAKSHHHPHWYPTHRRKGCSDFLPLHAGRLCGAGRQGVHSLLNSLHSSRLIRAPLPSSPAAQ